MAVIEIKKDDLYLDRFKEVFSSEEFCQKVLSEVKWENDFVCRKCGNTNYCKGKTIYNRRCTKCKTEESVTSGTIFHRCKIPLCKAFEILIMACQMPDISSYKISEMLEMRHMTCYSFRKKVLDCQDNSEDSVFVRKLIIKINSYL